MTSQGLELAATATGPTMIVTLGILAAFGPMSMDMYLPSLPAIQVAFGATTGEVQLTLSCFTIGFAVGQLVYGPLSDRFGRRWVLISGILIYVAASMLCVLVRDIEGLIVVRFIQALGGGAGMVLTRAVVRDLHARDAAARVLSLIFMVTMIAPLVAPFLEGYILKYLGWRAIFWLSAIGASRFGIGAAVGALVGFLHDGTAMPMGIIIACCAVASAASFWLMTQDRKPSAV